jgi:hypothetical protein
VTDLVKVFEDALPQLIDEEGFPRPPLFALHHDDTLTMATMAIPGEQIFATALNKFMVDLTVKELIFCIDQFTKPDQGTKYADALIVFWWQGERIGNYGFRFGVVNYRPEPNLIIEPIDWDNVFWNARMLRIVEHEQQSMRETIAGIREVDPEKVDRIERIVSEVKDKLIRGE